MRKSVMMMLTGLMVLVLAGCATTGSKMDDHGMMDSKVKCPACGFEFNEPSDA
ncbi:hypothetical protein [Syntrophotalea acetylenivorans]|uniref:hypothetical protein n=1 Tax=Syntrophotalea acetylenivorans TaxID=1842532 RepID=UPI000A4429A0|nr:hypothetical protein [Syntrophotalea acetylenivorans]